MMQRRSPPKHRHDGTSPLPLGMDWSPPPKKWNGRDTLWPHDPRTGWSYCITIPSWIVLPKSRDSDPVVFYRVQVGLQSPDGVTTTRGILRRFNDFLKLFADRRRSLDDWMTKLLSDIDLSRSVQVASFLELEAAARSSFQDMSQSTSEANSDGNRMSSSLQMPHNSSLSLFAGSSSITSDYGSDTAYETSEHGTPRLGRETNSETGIEDLILDDDLTNPIEKLVKYGMSNIDEGLFMGQTILEQLEGFPRHKANPRHVSNVFAKDTYNGNASNASFLASNGLGLFAEPEPSKMVGHVRKLSNESVGSDGSSLRGSEISNSYLDLPGVTDVSSTGGIIGNTDLHFPGDAQIVLPLDQRHKMNRVLLLMQQRLVTVKTDMEDLIARLNQEIAVKDYLNTKVTDLEVELETTKQKNKENLQQAILTEREKLTQMQWDMEELRQKSLRMELKLQSKQDAQSSKEPKEQPTGQEKDVVLQELDLTKQQLENLSRQYEELEAKSKADIKILVKEVKSLRSSQTQLKQELNQSLREKSEAQKLLQQERQVSENAKAAREKLLHECRALHNQLIECNAHFSIGEDHFAGPSNTLEGALDLLSTSDQRIGLLLSEAQLLLGVDEANDKDMDRTLRIVDDLRKMLLDIITENAKLRKQVNSLIRHALKMNRVSMNNEDVRNASE
ncbi:PX domain-containing protein EREL1 isoform X2 [Carica papaya]|uniref:PX domain-containing protein EREL1 isoform X2 n=1 Tax=Carica papaya TaxID=3649 RepID=UPI000B8CBDA6|nr:PX domain-containing protein EREL1 isoform X2 [Carica papaya]